MVKLRVLAACLGLLLIGPAVGQAEEAEEQTSDARARAIMGRAAQYLANAQSFGFEAETEYDVVQESGQTLEFGGLRAVQVRRPDRFRTRVVNRSGEERQLRFNGREAVLYSPQLNVYAKAAMPGDIDQALERIVEKLDQPSPLAELIGDDLDQIIEEVESALYVGEATLEGVRCHHLSFDGPEVDWQIWISEGDEPLPRRLVITYHSFEGSPRFRARLRSWDLSAELPDSLFDFEPPPGAMQVPLVAAVAPPDEEPIPPAEEKEER